MLSGDGQIFQLGLSDAMAVSGERKDAQGNPVRSYSKTILRAGVTVRNTVGRAVTITRDLLDAIAASFGKMKAAGIKVPVQVGHNEDAEKTRGYVLETWREGDDLKSTVEMIGADAISLASRSEVSVWVEPSHEVNGVVYPCALTHLACVPDPQVKGLGAFEPIAASLSGQVFSLSRKQGPSNMWKNLTAVLGLDAANLDDTTGPAAVESAVRSLKTTSTATANELAASKNEVGALKLSLSPAPPDQGMLDDAADVVDGKLSQLVDKGIVNPSQRTKLAALFMGETGKRPALCLSRSAATKAGLSAPIALSVIDILSEGKGNGASGRSKTGHQGAPPTEEVEQQKGRDDFKKLVDAC